MQEELTPPAKKQRSHEPTVSLEQASCAHEWTSNAAVISNVVRFLPTGQDVLRCELVNSTWRSSTMCPLLPPMRLTTQALNKTGPLCLSFNARRLASLRSAFTVERWERMGADAPDQMQADNKAALEMLANSATSLSFLALDHLGYRVQDSIWGRLTSLTYLELNNSTAYALPASLGALSGLRHLSIRAFSEIRSLATKGLPWLQQLTNLTTLAVTHANNFTVVGGPLPSSLQELNFDNNPFFERLPSNTSALTDLRSFTISGDIGVLPAALGSQLQLSRLCFSSCDRLRQLPDNLACSTSIQCLSVTTNALIRHHPGDAGSMAETPKIPGYLQDEGGLQKMPAIASLAISLPRCSCMLAGLTPTASMSCLTSLHIHSSPVMRSAGEHGLERYLAGLTALRCLQLSGITRVETLDSVSMLTALTALSLEGAEALVALPNLVQLGLLQRLVVKGCSKVKALPEVQGLVSLRHLRLQDMMNLAALPAELGELVCLQELIVYFCPCVRKFPASMQHLQLQLLSIGTLNECCRVAKSMVASAKQRKAYRQPTDVRVELVGAVGSGGVGCGMLGGAL